MEDSKKNAYIVGVIFSGGAVFFLMMAINIGWNLSGQFLGVFGLFSGILGVGSLLKPETIGQIAAQMWENMQENAKEQNRSRNTKTTTTKIIAKGDVYNITDSANTKINSSKKSSTRKKK